VSNFNAAVRKLEACFVSDEQQYLLGTATPCSSDFGLYGMLNRLVDNAFDANVGPCRASALSDTGAVRLGAWYRRMLAQFPLRFFNRA
jgi:hypothetical protein